MSRSRIAGYLITMCIFLLWITGDNLLQAEPQVDQAVRQPIRVGGNVQESKLRHRVEPVYPPEALAARVTGVVILQVTVNEQGDVIEAKVMRGHPLLSKSAVEAVQQWRYEPTLLNGEPVPVVATVTVIFNVKGDEFRLTVDESGSLRDMAGQLEGPALVQKARESRSGIIISASPRVPLRVIEGHFRTLQREGIQIITVQGYEVREGRLFSTLPPDVQAPEIDLDRDRLAAIARASGAVDGLPPAQKPLIYKVFITEIGEIVAVEQRRGPRIPVLEAELQRMRIITPGRRGADPLPVVFYLEIPIP